jgi:cellulose synthase/poly-beta-1,6-N-acetylglucosamine synthase-like glycosyltransferase
MALGGGNIAGKTPNMCNGANLAYRKTAFEAIGGFSHVDTFASGDDEMLLQKMHAHGLELRFARDFRAIVYSPAMPSWPALKRQRLRWVSKARFYPNRGLNLLQLMSYGAFAGVPFLALAGFFAPVAWLLLLLNLTLKTAADAWLMFLASRLLRRPYLLTSLIPMQIAYLIYVLWVGVAGNLVKSFEWKGRTVN